MITYLSTRESLQPWAGWPCVVSTAVWCSSRSKLNSNQLRLRSFVFIPPSLHRSRQRVASRRHNPIARRPTRIQRSPSRRETFCFRRLSVIPPMPVPFNFSSFVRFWPARLDEALCRFSRWPRIESATIRSDRERSREISASRYRHEARQSVIAIAIAVPDCHSFYRCSIDCIANIDRTISFSLSLSLSLSRARSTGSCGCLFKRTRSSMRFPSVFDYKSSVSLEQIWISWRDRETFRVYVESSRASSSYLIGIMVDHRVDSWILIISAQLSDFLHYPFLTFMSTPLVLLLISSEVRKRSNVWDRRIIWRENLCRFLINVNLAC